MPVVTVLHTQLPGEVMMSRTKNRFVFSLIVILLSVTPMLFAETMPGYPQDYSGHDDLNRELREVERLRQYWAERKKIHEKLELPLEKTDEKNKK